EPSPRVPCNQLHHAARDGLVELTLARLSSGSIDRYRPRHPGRLNPFHVRHQRGLLTRC
ncbi:unnamed protein product, partial [Ectocarpus sp. 4 AP-2014]